MVHVKKTKETTKKNGSQHTDAGPKEPQVLDNSQQKKKIQGEKDKSLLSA